FPWLLPLLRAFLPLGTVGESLDAAFVTMCHRLPERTLLLAGLPMPVCSRCAGVFAGVALGALVSRPHLSARALRWAITLPSPLPPAPPSPAAPPPPPALPPLWPPPRLTPGLTFGYALAAACIHALQHEAHPT